jgi:membrane protease YdiL (CAAX protease family)
MTFMEEIEASTIKRALWRRIADFPLVVMVIAAVVIILVRLLAPFVIGTYLGFNGIHPTPKQMVALMNGPYLIPAALITIVASIAAYKLIIRHMGRHPRDDLSWTNKSARELSLGLLAGFVIMALAVGVAAVLGVYQITGPGDGSQLIAELLGTAILAGVWEEILFRGILFRWIEEFGGSWLALLLTSAFFGAAHLGNPNATSFAALCIAVEAGLLLGAAYMLTRSLWLPMGLHAAWNFTQGEIFDVPVSGLDEHGLVTAQMSGPPLLSGNGFGLEASVIGLTVATAAGLWFLWLSAKSGQVMAPMWVRRRKVEAAA